MNAIDLANQPSHIHAQAAKMLVEDFDEPYAWPNLSAAQAEVARVMADGFARAVLDTDLLLGWVGGLPEYGGHVWELHPLVVRRTHRRRRLGRALVSAFESEARARGALTITLGTDDRSGMTSLSGVHLYDDVPGHIARLCDLGQNHPFLFYRKLGFIVTGIMPDANGPGHPDIYMSKAVRR